MQILNSGRRELSPPIINRATRLREGAYEPTQSLVKIRVGIGFYNRLVVSISCICFESRCKKLKNRDKFFIKLTETVEIGDRLRLCSGGNNT
jgi:hypothetical protein